MRRIMKQPNKAPIYENHPFVFAFRANGGDSYKINDITDNDGHRTGYAVEVAPGMPLPNLKEYLVKTATL